MSTKTHNWLMVVTVILLGVLAVYLFFLQDAR